MEMPGGYFMVDASGYDYYDTESQTITGLYAQCQKAYASGKPVFLYGWDYNGVIMSPTVVYLLPSTNAFIIDGKISVSNADAVTRL